ncbi:hypothetical protein MCU_00342 [Bartonella elizabethae Re6043vi]|uniref:Polysaccharide chain length determinant N-terminal domain-containing protein n=2 Tax=Bartonella elizabethae TaxID=807 RepID=J1KD86_BAREL|nr:hypothetical protein [Bartonella elizabethae]EJF84764.1 hypothetical protein MCU_00342 [Bartonella elizabethae Re6043vi]EJF95802.1 hypothetical protein MEE_01039 [Bartonella elizabethae F9251 = ATCC 49927]VEJ41223.1 Capsular polysaccharide biosynthesis protein [Bartonella elizabethae]
MSLKWNKRLFVRAVWRNILIVLLLQVLCISLISFYYFIQPRGYQATIAFSLSDSVGKPLSIEKQDNIIAFLFSQPIFFDDSSFSLSASYKKKKQENIRLSRHGDLINLTFHAETLEAAQQGVETWFSAFSQAIIQQKQSLLNEKLKDKQYDNAAIVNIMQGFRASVDSFIQHGVKQTELHDLSTQLTQATLKRIHLTSLNSTINMMREKGQSLLSLSLIAGNSAIVSLESKRDLLETQRAHMAAQLGWTHPQIKAMTAELEAVSYQLKNKILQIVNQVHSDEIIATELEKQLKKRVSFFVKDQSQSLNEIFNAFENKIKAEIDAQNKAMSKPTQRSEKVMGSYRGLSDNSLLLQNVKIHVVTPTKLAPISFIALYGKNILVSALVSFLTLLLGIVLFYPCFRSKKDQLSEENLGSKENALKKNESMLVSQEMKNFEAFITIEGLSDVLKWRASTVISIIGPEAARTAAKLSLHLTKEHKTILLVDISGQQIEKVIGPHRGLSDILTGHAQLHDVIYRDYDTGVDILPQGLTSAVSAQDFSNNISYILQEFKKEYDFIILEMASEPKYGVEQFAELTDYYICHSVLNEQDWMMRMVSCFPKTVYRVVAL